MPGSTSGISKSVVRLLLFKYVSSSKITVAINLESSVTPDQFGTGNSINVDSKKSKAPFKYQNWMSINTFDEYKVRYNYLKEAAIKEKLSPAQYELIEFNNYKRKNA